MVSIQQSQNKDTLGRSIKLNELSDCQVDPGMYQINIDDLTKAKSEVLKKFHSKLAGLSEKEKLIFRTRTVDKADIDRSEKRQRTKINSTSHKTKKDARIASFKP